MTPAGLTSHACYPSTALAKVPEKGGTNLGKPDTFCSFCLHPPTAAVDLQRSVSYNPFPSDRSLYCSPILIGVLLAQDFCWLRLLLTTQMFNVNVYPTGDSGLMCRDAVNLLATTS